MHRYTHIRIYIHICIQDPGSKIQDPRSKIRDPRSKIQHPRSRIQDPGSKIQDPLYIYTYVYDTLYIKYGTCYICDVSKMVPKWFQNGPKSVQKRFKKRFGQLLDPIWMPRLQPIPKSTEKLRPFGVYNLTHFGPKSVSKRFGKRFQNEHVFNTYFGTILNRF